LRFDRKLWLSASLLAICLYFGFSPLGTIPALGPFLDPVRGIWASARGTTLPSSIIHTVPGLSGEVQIIYDDRRVPHIFAKTTEDVFRGLGYAVAKDRLFQLEIQTRATAGTLTELLGEDLLPVDRKFRQLALAWSAENDYSRMVSKPNLNTSLKSYSDGVNAWISNMSPSEVPIEYHLLGQKPMSWKPQYSLYLLKRMGWTLTMINTEQRKNAAAALVGREAADGLFPVNSPIQEPIQPNGLQQARFDPMTLPPPGQPNPSMLLKLGKLQDFLGPTDEVRISSSETTLGSNNWAISPSRSANGRAILAGDPHLDLTLPSIWYEAHLVVPGELDVYGVTIPGTPAIIMGFNRNVAWTFTNTGSDVMDLYRETVDDSNRPQQYQLDGDWLPFDRRIEIYRAQDKSVLAIDTILHTHRGPVLRESNEYTSLRWTVLDDHQGTLMSLIGVSSSGSVEEWLAEMETWISPTQNGLVADRQGNIAIRSSGKYPIRPLEGRGDWIYDGSVSSNDWQGWYPLSSYPGSVNPDQGYLSSSNQQPVDPSYDNRYWGSDWPSPWRAMRINHLLRKDADFTVADLTRFQTDSGSPRADLFVEAFLQAAKHNFSNGDTIVAEAAKILSEWDKLYTKDNTRAVLFELAMNELTLRTWDELTDSIGNRIATPRSYILASLLADPTNIWWDNNSTPNIIESRDDILKASLANALLSARDMYGPESGNGWTWDQVANANVFHLLGIPAFSALGLPISGGPGTLNPNSFRPLEKQKLDEPVRYSSRHGASWRMVVELGDEIKGYGVYPGGQSGHPLSSYYRDRIDDWIKGELQPLRFPKNAQELADFSISETILLPDNKK